MTLKHLYLPLLLLSTFACSNTKPQILSQPVINETVVVTEELPEAVLQVEPVVTPVEEIETKEEVEIKALEPVKAEEEIETFKEVRLTWQAPEEKLIRYFIEYGHQKNKLSNKKTIEMIELLNIDHPKYGSIFIYTLKDIPSKATLYYRLQSENDVGLSKKSKILRVP